MMAKQSAHKGSASKSEKKRKPKTQSSTTAPASLPERRQSAPLPSGTQTILHDAVDARLFEEARADYGRLARLAEEKGKQLETAIPLIRDLFWTFHKRAPRVDDKTELRPSYRINREIIEQIISTKEWRDVRLAGTINDSLTSAMATIGAADKAIAALPPETQENLSRLHGLEESINRLFENADTLDEMARESESEDRRRELKGRAEEARQSAGAELAEAEEVAAHLLAGQEARDDAVRQAARAGLRDAAREIEETNAAVNSFSYGIGGGRLDGRGGASGARTKDKIALAERVSRNPMLKQLAALTGRMQRIALEAQRVRVKHPPDEITSVTIGDDIGRVLPSELTLLADDELEPLFYKKLLDTQLMVYEMIGHEPQGQGPIVAALDNSSSMQEPLQGQTKEVWSKAVILGLLTIARKQKRDMAVIHFSGRTDQIKVHEFEKGEATPAQVLDCVEHFYGGGTIFEPWMERAVELIDESRYNRADVICLSDGIARISLEARNLWNERRVKREMRAYGVLLGTRVGLALLGEITDRVFTLDDLTKDREVLTTIYGI